MAEPGIIINKLSKRYGKSGHAALNSLSIKVNHGEVYGFLGPNGAGKSTTIRLLMNFIQPTNGSATILGKDIVSQSLEIKRDIGYLSGDMAIYPKMSGQQFLDYMHELQPATSKAYVTELSSRLKAELRKPMGELSRGNRQKIGIIQALMHQPKVIILDEPTSGLDPLMQEEFYKLIKEAKERDSVIFASSHIMSEVQKMCDRVGIIRDGKLVAERNISEMVNEAAQTFDITFKNLAPVDTLKKIKGLKVISHHANTISIHVHGELAPLFAELAKQHVIHIDARNLDLEETFIGFYEDKRKTL